MRTETVAATRAFGPTNVAVEASDCRALWLAVLGEQLRLVFDPGTVFADTLAARQAADWFGGRDFHLVCFLGGVDSDYVLRRYTARLAAKLQAERAENERAVNDRAKRRARTGSC
jgi:hypothetical protein